MIEHARVVVLASKPKGEDGAPGEGAPLVLMEAMGAGRPVVGTALPGIVEVIEGCGSLVDPPDAAHLAEALRPYLEDPQLAARTGAKGRARVQERMTLDRTVADLSALYVRLAAETRDTVNTGGTARPIPSSLAPRPATRRTSGTEEPVEVRRYIDAIRRARWMIAAITVLLTGVVVGVSVSVPSSYTAEASIVKQVNSGAFESVDPAVVTRELNTIGQLLTTSSVLDAAARKLPGETGDSLAEKVESSVDPDANLIYVTAHDGHRRRRRADRQHGRAHLRGRAGAGRPPPDRGRPRRTCSRSRRGCATRPAPTPSCRRSSSACPSSASASPPPAPTSASPRPPSRPTSAPRRSRSATACSRSSSACSSASSSRSAATSSSRASPASASSAA